MIKPRAFLIFAFSVFLVFSISANYSANEAYACSCVVPDSPEKELQRHDAVFSGNVISMEELHPTEPLYFSGDPVVVTFEIDKIWKGLNSSDSITVHTAQSSASCGYGFETNQKYIVYASYDDEKEQLEVSLCSRTSLLSDASEDLEELGTGMSIDPVFSTIVSPLKQFKTGVPADEIQCRESLTLVAKNNGSPACVTESTKQKLMERGWSSTNITEIKNDFENDATTQMVVDPVDEFYFSDDEIVIRGSVWDSEKTDLQKIPVLVQIHFGDELIDVAQAQLSDDGIFSHSVVASGPLWQQNGIYTITASYDSGIVAKNRFGFSSYYQDHSEKYFVNSDTDNYEDLCGYPVTHEMRRNYVESMKQGNDRVPLVESNQGVFSHVERSLYLTDMPRLQYWYDIKDGRQMYFVVEACVFDDFNVASIVYLSSNHEKPQDIVIDGVYHKVLSAPGYPLIYKDSLLPVLDVDNCKRVADNYTKKERQELYTREHAGPEASWDHQVFPLMDYCTGVGNYEMSVIDGKINWSFTVK